MDSLMDFTGKVYALTNQELFNEAIMLMSDEKLDYYTDETLFQLRGFCYSQISRFDEAIEDFTKGLVINSSNIELLEFRAGVWFEKKEFDNAINDYSLAIKIGPRNFTLFYYRGHCWSEKKEFEKAIDDYTECIKLNSEKENIFYYRGVAYYEINKLNEARTDFTESIRVNPDSFKSFYYRGLIHYDLNEFNSAITEFTKSILLNDLHEKSFFFRGISYSKLKEFKNAIEDFSHSITLSPSDGESFLFRGIAFYELKEWDKAILDFNEAIDKLTDNRVPLLHRGYIWYKKNEYDAAISDFTKCIENAKNNNIIPFATAYYNRGVVWAEKNEFTKAIEDYNQSIDIDPDGFQYFNARALVWVKINEFDKALADYDEALRINPLSEVILTNRGKLWLANNKLEKATVDFKNALKINEKYTLALYETGVLCSIREEHQLASAYFKRAYFLGDPGKYYIDKFSNDYPSPLILHEILMQGTDEKSISAYNTEIMYVENECNSWLPVLTFINTFRNIICGKEDYLRLEAIVNFYMGHSINAFSIYDTLLGEENLSLRDQYYFALSAANFIEPNEGILHFAIKQFQELKSPEPEDLYYAGQLYLLNMEHEKAETCFKEAGNFLPALYGLISIAKRQKDFTVTRQIANRIVAVEFNNDDAFLNGIKPVTIEHETTSEDFTSFFSKRLHYYELIEEINEVRAIVNPGVPYKHVEFQNLLQCNDEFRTFLDAKIKQKEIYHLEKEIIRVFVDRANELSAEELENQIKYNIDAQKIILETEGNCNRYKTTVEEQLAMSISLLQYSAEWYILLIKYFYKEKMLSSRAAVLLHYYTLKIAQQKKDTTIIKEMDLEIKLWLPHIKAWTPLISTALNSHFISKMLISVWVNYVSEKPQKAIDNFSDYRNFKKSFRSDYLAWWIDDLCLEKINSRK